MVWEDTIEQAPVLRVLNCVVTCLSLFGSVLMWYFCQNMNPKSTHLKMIRNIAISDFFFGISNFMSTFQSSSLNLFCEIEAFIRAISFTLSIVFTTSIAILCFKTSVPAKSFDPDKLFYGGCIIGFGMSLVLVIAPAFINDIEYTNGSVLCLITYAPGLSRMEMFWIRTMYEGLTIFGGLIITLICYLGTIRRMKRLPKYFLVNMNVNLSRLFWYPVALFITFVPSLVDNYVTILTGTDEPVAVRIIYLTLCHLIGFTNAIVYGLQMKLSHIPKKVKKQTMNELCSFETASRSYSIAKELIQASGEF